MKEIERPVFKESQPEKVRLIDTYIFLRWSERGAAAVGNTRLGCKPHNFLGAAAW
ncbi:hypothetical protein [Neisseria arctica]|uniref:hypothetical protein n=1 Tax=Neisseria arctica TaxID=1470200 RepID=UPI000A496CB6|nr:hypothetical protein [Neisseria arctica]UOO87145.1 hypothetical protein LVJ86_02525 [Neisseria arctica]